MNGCRIGRVRMKGGADVRILNTEYRSEAAKLLINHASTIAAYERADSKIISTVVIAVFSDGGISTGMRHYKNCSVPRWAMPAIVEEAVRDGFIGTPEATDIVNRALGLDE